MTNYKLTQINIYPVKSLPGISLKKSLVEERGFQYDRRWMLIDEKNNFITQRTHPQMSLLNVKINDNEIIFSHNFKKLENLIISLSHFPQKNIKVKIWNDFVEAVLYKDDINKWFAAAINGNVKLVYMPNSTERKTSTKYFKESKNVSFADGYPFLIIGEKSLELLNSKLAEPISMERFRPNLVFSGGKPHDEDSWEMIKINTISFSVIKPCARCVITTINPLTGIKNKEPLTTLSKYRKVDSKVLFGQNAIALSEGKIQIGDKITLR